MTKMMLSEIFKSVEKNGLTHTLHKVRNQDKYMYLVYGGDKKTRHLEYINGEEAAKKAVMKAIGKNPFKEVICE